MTAAEAVARTLADAGVRHASGLIGSTVAPVVDALAADPRLRIVSTRHEQVAAHLADAAARLTRRPTICYGHGAPGGLNLVMGVATAYRDSSPLVVLTGDVEREQHGREAWQSLDGIVDVFRPVTKASWRVERPEDAAEMAYRAVLTAVSGRPGPVHLQLPRDVSRAALAAAPEPRGELPLPAVRPSPDPAAVAAMAEALARAARPVILAGGGIVWSSAEAALAALAERLGAPVLTSQTCRGVLDETGPWCLGAPGHMGNPAADRALAEADVVLAVGDRLSDLQTDYGKLWRGQLLLHADIDPTELGRYYPARVTACADARAFLGDLAAALHPRPRPAWLEPLLAERDAWYARRLAPGSSFGPGEVVAAVAEVAPPESVVTIGAGRHAQFSAALPRTRPGGHLKAIGSAAMGFAFPAALAAKAVAPERPAVALVGDGDFLMGVHDLETARREGLAAVTVVFNDFRLASQAGPGRTVGVRHGNPDFADLSRTFGCFGAVARNYDELCAVLRQALEGGSPALIDARLEG